MIVIIGSGISGLALSYFLSSQGIRNTVIDKKIFVGREHRTTGLVSDKIFKFLRFLDENEVVVKEFSIAKFWYDFKMLLKIKSFNKMYLVDYQKLENEIFKNIDKKYSTFLFGERVLDVSFMKNAVITNKRKMKFDVLVDASGTQAFLANKFNLFRKNKIFSAFESFCKIKNTKREFFSDINIFFDKKFSKCKFGWLISFDGKALIGLIDYKLKKEIFEKFKNNFFIERKIYEYFHTIRYAELKKYVYKDSLIVGEAAGLVKPFSLGGITYGIISSFFAFKSIKSNNLELYEKKIRMLFFKPKILGKIIDKFIRRKSLVKMLRSFSVDKFIRKLDPDFIFY